MADKIQVKWDPEAERLLRKRGPFANDTIRREFEPDPQKTGTIEIDEARHRYVTPVDEKRYVVVWDLNRDEKIAAVRAVVPAQLIAGNRDEIRAQINTAVEFESRGKVRLK